MRLGVLLPCELFRVTDPLLDLIDHAKVYHGALYIFFPQQFGYPDLDVVYDLVCAVVVPETFANLRKITFERFICVRFYNESKSSEAYLLCSLHFVLLFVSLIVSMPSASSSHAASRPSSCSRPRGVII